MKPFVITNSITRRDHKSLDRYLADISKFAVLTPDQELKLFKHYKSGDETALQKIVQHNLRFVVSVAKQYENQGLGLGDLISEGNIGILTAAQKFDETKGFKFISYAVWWIRQAMFSAIASNGRKIRLPVNYQSISVRIRKVQGMFLHGEGREPNIEELMEETGHSKEVILRYIAASPWCGSLDVPLKEGESNTLVDAVEDPGIEQPDHQLVYTESQQREVQALLSSLSPKEAFILSSLYGLGSKYPLTLDDIGLQMGISSERVRQIRDRSVLKLRKKT